jgi:hypothetical protein
MWQGFRQLCSGRCERIKTCSRECRVTCNEHKPLQTPAVTVGCPCFYQLMLCLTNEGLGCITWQEQEILLSSAMPGQAQEPTQPPVQSISAVCPRVKWLGLVADHFICLALRLTMTSTILAYIFLDWRVIEHRDSFMLLFVLLH